MLSFHKHHLLCLPIIIVKLYRIFINYTPVIWFPPGFWWFLHLDCLLIPKHSSRKCFVLIAVPAPMVSWITSASPGSCRLHFSHLWWRFLEKMETLETYIVPQDFDGAVEGIALKSSTDGVDEWIVHFQIGPKRQKSEFLHNSSWCCQLFRSSPPIS